MFDSEIMNLVTALKNDTGDDAARLEAYEQGEFIYGITIDNRLNGDAKVVMHVQWPRLHCWIVNAQREGKKLVWDHSALGPEPVHVYVRAEDSIINYTAILERPVLLDMLKEHGHQVDPEMAAEDLWNLVLKYECL